MYGGKTEKKGGRVMMLTRKDVVMGKVVKEEGMAEKRNGRKRDLVVVYLRPKTNDLGEVRICKHGGHMQMFKE